MLTIYVDESGDLGWSFGAPYHHGGSSRYLTIGALCVPPSKKHHPKRLVKDLYQRFHWPSNVEKKWSDMSEAARSEFVKAAGKMCAAHPDIGLQAITVKKENVKLHIRQDANKLYNYMIRLSLLNRMAMHDEVTLIPDPRSIKVESGNSLHDYLQIGLWFEKSVKTVLRTTPMESHNCVNLQFADMLAGLVQCRYENQDLTHFRMLRPNIRLSNLYFGP
jgi:hypothetical protein